MTIPKLIEISTNFFVLDASQYFATRVNFALEQIEQSETGKRLLEKIKNKSHKVFILPQLDGKASEHHKFIAKDYSIILLSLQLCQSIGLKALEKIDSDIRIRLAHELIHAYHCAYGKRRSHLKTISPEFWTNDEEFYTIMGKIPSKNHLSICENSIRMELGLPLRITHLIYYEGEKDTALQQQAELGRLMYYQIISKHSIQKIESELEDSTLDPTESESVDSTLAATDNEDPTDSESEDAAAT